MKAQSGALCGPAAPEACTLAASSCPEHTYIHLSKFIFYYEKMQMGMQNFMNKEMLEMGRIADSKGIILLYTGTHARTRHMNRFVPKWHVQYK